MAKDVGGTAATVCSPSFRVIERKSINSLTGEVSLEYQIQERVRSWWTLFLGFTWVTVAYEGGLPGYYFQFVFGSQEKALEQIAEIERSRAWSKTETSVVDVR